VVRLEGGEYKVISSKDASWCPELNMAHQLPDKESSLTIPSDLVTMERLYETTSDYNISFMTPRIADIVYKV